MSRVEVSFQGGQSMWGLSGVREKIAIEWHVKNW
jgi:hypothetical protein